MKTLNVELHFSAPNDYNTKDIDKIIKYITDEWIYDILHKNNYKLIDYTISEKS
jgi:hypothetical protein